MAGNMDFELSPQTVRSTYIATYSKADVTKIPTRESFATAVVESFPDTEKTKIVQWSCCLESHVDGSPHYHMAIKFSGNRRWKESKNYLMKKHGIVVHYSGSHDDYATAFEYITKDDKQYIKSADHPPLIEIQHSKSRNAHAAWRSKATNKRASNDESGAAGSSTGETKRRKITVSGVSQFIIKNNIHTEKEMYESINKQKKEGQNDLNEFVLSRPVKFLQDLLHRSWKIENAVAAKERENMNRMDILSNELHTTCIDGCKASWLKCAKEVLQNNKINPYVFASAIRSTIRDGRGKGNNVMLYGDGDCGKTFLLLPTTVIFNAFTNPAKTSFAWVGVEEKELIFLNDMRWSETTIEWGMFLNLLDGNEVRFPRPKNFHASDIVMSRNNTLPVFATSIGKIKFHGENEDIENDMMDSRWIFFHLFHKIAKKDQIKLNPCGRCFAEMVMLGSEFE